MDSGSNSSNSDHMEAQALAISSAAASVTVDVNVTSTQSSSSHDTIMASESASPLLIDNTNHMTPDTRDIASPFTTNTNTTSDGITNSSSSMSNNISGGNGSGSSTNSTSSSPRTIVRKRQRFTSTRVAANGAGSSSQAGSSIASGSTSASPIPPQPPVPADLLTSVPSDFQCYLCISQHLSEKQDCPICRAPLRRDQIFPNFLWRSRDTLIDDQEQEPRVKLRHDLLSHDDYTREEIDMLMSTLQAKKRKLESADQQVELEVLLDFLSNTHDEKEKALKELNLQIQCLDNDMRKAREKLASLKQLKDYQSTQSLEEEDDDQLECMSGFAGVQVPNEVSEEEDEAVPPQTGSKRSHSQLERDDKGEENGLGKASAETTLQSMKIAKQINVNKKRVASHFEDLQRCYFDISLNQSTKRESALSSFCSTISKFTKFSHFEHINTLRYADIFNTSSIVSSIEFDRDDEYFATAGVTKKIKIFEYGCIEKTGLAGTRLRDDDRSEMYEGSDLSRTSRYSSNKKPISSVLHYPVREMMCRSKISCLSWNSYIKSQIASSDYEGIVSLWDAQTGVSTQHYDEHEKRAWSVDFSRTDPTRLASGSDDTKVKIWSTTVKASVCTIESKANICCVKFNPESSHHIAFGSADHHIHYYDLRKANDPLFVFKGHRKAVSYVKFLGRDELVSASTDSTLKLWNTQRMNCARTYTGHVNEKNFVGLSASGDWISCGSENNAVYTYYKELRDPVVTVKFGNSNPVTGEDTLDEDPSQFVSSVCWKKNTSNNILLAANSSGVIKVLELV
ncbi:RING finger and WD repeat domain-containing protein 2 [Mortierella claussenii]|nr:RING finger and WD repeat domain-containing protein 2 [Mortierella claussenii]